MSEHDHTDANPPRDSNHLALIGLMGSGKSSVGAVLAERLGWALVDTDHLVEANTGHSIAHLFQSQGEAAFRRFEVDSLGRALAREEPSVIATGGGIVTSPVARRMLSIDATVVWLRARPEVLARRVGNDSSRPLLGGRDPLVALTELHHGRAPLYAEVADAEVDAEADDPEQVAEAVLDVLGWHP